MSTTAMVSSTSERDIRGVYKYCDNWCDQCPVTSRCTAFRVSQSWAARRGTFALRDQDDMVAFTREVAAVAHETTPGLDAMLAEALTQRHEATDFASGKPMYLTRTGP